MSVRWTALPPLELFGVGTDRVESLEHYVQRQAWTTGRNPAEWFGRSILGSTSFFCGPGTSFLSTADRMQQLTGRSDLHCGTLRNLGGLATHGYMGLSSKARRWCPVCYAHWDEATSYELLAWHMPHISRCPIHGCVLERICRKCLAKQRLCRRYAKRRSCGTCGSSLAGEGLYRDESRYASWAEAESLLLILRCAEPGRRACDHNACNIFATGAAEGILQDPHTPESVRQGLGRVLEYANGIGCDMDTLLNLCAMQGVHLVDALEDPVGAASHPLAWMRSTQDVRDYSCEASKVGLIELEDLVQRIIANGKRPHLPSLWVLAQMVGVSFQHVRRHWSPMLASYEKLLGGADPGACRVIDQWHLCAASFVKDHGIDPFDVFDPTWVAAGLAKRMGGVNLNIFAAMCSFEVLRLRDEVAAVHRGTLAARPISYRRGKSSSA